MSGSLCYRTVHLVDIPYCFLSEQNDDDDDDDDDLLCHLTSFSTVAQLGNVFCRGSVTALIDRRGDEV